MKAPEPIAVKHHIVAAQYEIESLKDAIHSAESNVALWKDALKKREKKLAELESTERHQNENT